MFELSVIPIINANDVVSIKNLDFDENDTLSAIVAKLCGADLLVMLTAVDGLYTGDPSDPESKFIDEVDNINYDIIGMAKGSGSAVGSGGMLTKIEAAQIAVDAGIDTVIIGNKDLRILYDLFEQDSTRCTWFKAQSDNL